jgi:peptide chain release factor 1
VQNSCRLKHIPTGIVCTAQTRSRISSLQNAKDALLELLQERLNKEYREQTSEIRKMQTGTGERGDKIRTYRFQDNSVKDHNTEKTASLDKVIKGNFNLLW